MFCDSISHQEPFNVFFFFLVELPPRVMCVLLIKMAKIEVRLASGCTENPQLTSLIASFQTARDTVTLEA